MAGSGGNRINVIRPWPLTQPSPPGRMSPPLAQRVSLAHAHWRVRGHGAGAADRSTPPARRLATPPAGPRRGTRGSRGGRKRAERLVVGVGVADRWGARQRRCRHVGRQGEVRQDPPRHAVGANVTCVVVHQERGALGHAPAAAASTPTHTVRASGTPARTEPSALARERDQALGLAPSTPEPRKPAREEAARQERPQLLLDKARHALAVAAVRGLGEERLQVLPCHPMQHVRSGITRGVINRRQGHRIDWGRSRADRGGASACGVVVTRRFAVAISTYGERAACGISCTRDDARERPKTPALTHTARDCDHRPRPVSDVRSCRPSAAPAPPPTPRVRGRRRGACPRPPPRGRRGR